MKCLLQNNKNRGKTVEVLYVTRFILILCTRSCPTPLKWVKLCIAPLLLLSDSYVFLFGLGRWSCSSAWSSYFALYFWIVYSSNPPSLGISFGWFYKDWTSWFAQFHTPTHFTTLLPHIQELKLTHTSQQRPWLLLPNLPPLLHQYSVIALIHFLLMKKTCSQKDYSKMAA